MDAVAPVVLQLYEVPPLPVSVTDEPTQMIPSLFVTPEVSDTAIDGVGSGLTVMIVDVVVEQPFASVTVTA
jgi:hypothetical protein